MEPDLCNHLFMGSKNAPKREKKKPKKPKAAKLDFSQNAFRIVKEATRINRLCLYQCGKPQQLDLL